MSTTTPTHQSKLKNKHPYFYSKGPGMALDKNMNFGLIHILGGRL
jgi:hypothetical protein